MTPRNRAIALIALSVVIIVGIVGSIGWRSLEWSDRGWVGIAFFPVSGGAETPTPKTLEERGIGPGYVFMVMPRSPAERAGIRERDRVVAINGIPLEETEKLVALDGELARGDLVSYEIVRGDETRQLSVRLESPFGSPLVVTPLVTGFTVGLVFLLIGSFVLWRRPSDRAALIFFAITVVACISLASAGLLNVESGTMRGITAQGNSLVLPFVALVGLLLAPLLAHLSLVYPRERPILKELPETFRWIYAVPVWVVGNVMVVALIGGVIEGHITTTVRGRTIERVLPEALRIGLAGALAAAAIAVLVGWFFAARKWGRRRALFTRQPLLVLGTWLFLVAPLLVTMVEIDLIRGVPSGVLLLLILAGPTAALLILPIVSCVSFYRSYRESDAEEKRQLRWPLWGMIVGIGGRLFIVVVTGAVTIYSFIRWGDPFPSFTLAVGSDVAAKLVYLLVPVSFAFSILKYRLMEIDLIIRRTIVYTIVSGIVAFLWLALAGGVGALIVQTTHIENQTIAVAATLLVGLVFVPLRNRLQKLVDHRYQKSEEGLTAIERRIGRDIANSSDLESLLHRLAEEVQQAVETSTVLFLLPDGGGGSRIGAAVGLPQLDSGGGVDFERLGLLEGVESSEEWSLDEESTKTLRRMRAHTIVPLRRRGSLVGALVLGRRIDRRDLTLAQEAFLASIADQIAVGIDNIARDDDSEEFEQARDIQRALLPSRLPTIQGLRISGAWEPAKAVGGDYYDVIQLDERSVGICIADVAGKGMPAALLMSNLQAVVRAMAARDAAPAALCSRVRNIITTNLSGGKFITFFYCLVDLEAGQLRWANAGHLVPVLLSADGSVLRLDEGGPAFARLFSSLDYNEGAIEYAPGDRLLLFTDGVTEAVDAAGDQLGEERLIEHLTQRHDLRNADDVRDAVLQLVREHSNGAFADDVTLVAASWD